MIVVLEESRDGGLIAKVDGLICFFDRKFKGIEKELDPGDEVDVMFTGVNRKGSVLFMAPIRSYKLVRHKGFRPMGKKWDIMAESVFPKGLILLENIPLPIADGTDRNITLYPGYCWVDKIKHPEAIYRCVGVDNPWNLDFPGGKFVISSVRTWE